MKSDVLVISSEGNGMEEVLAQVDAVAAYKELSGKNAMYLRLLAEETMALMRAITGDVKGAFWIEDRDGAFEMHLKVETMTDEKKRDQLLAASTSGKNEATRGFMGKVSAISSRSHSRSSLKMSPGVRSNRSPPIWQVAPLVQPGTRK